MSNALIIEIHKRGDGVLPVLPFCEEVGVVVVVVVEEAVPVVVVPG